MERLRAVNHHLGPALAAESEAAALPTGGLFIDDYSTLPQPTLDANVARANMDKFGYCLLQDALSAAEVDRLVARIQQQPETDKMEAYGTESGSRQTAGSTQNRGPEFLDMIQHPRVTEVAAHVLGDHFNTQGTEFNVQAPGAEAVSLHTDTWWLPPPQRKSAPPRLRTGDVTRAAAYTSDWHAESEEFITGPVRCGVIWMATDFTARNGATMIVPGCASMLLPSGATSSGTDSSDCAQRISAGATRRQRKGRAAAGTWARSPSSARRGPALYTTGGSGTRSAPTPARTSTLAPAKPGGSRSSCTSARPSSACRRTSRSPRTERRSLPRPRQLSWSGSACRPGTGLDVSGSKHH